MYRSPDSNRPALCAWQLGRRSLDRAQLDELDEDQIRACLGDANIEEREDGLIIIDMLEEDGTWDQKNSLMREMAVAAIERFSHFPGAKNNEPVDATTAEIEPAAESKPEPAPAPEPVVEAVANVAPLQTKRLGDALLIIFPQERFDLEVASKLGKRDWDNIVVPVDGINGETKDMLYRTGADFVAPIEFFSEVFVEGKPLSKPQFEKDAHSYEGAHSGVRSMEVQLPRFGPVLLFTRPDGSRFVSSNLGEAESLLGVLG